MRAQWVSFVNETAARSSVASSLFAGDTQEKDYTWGDLDQDGDIDLVIVRKQPFTTGGHFPNVLLMNEGGVLTDRSATLTGSTVAGSQGFLDATNDRDVVIVDVNGDGWHDVVTCTTLTASRPEYIRAPRVYVNLGVVGGVWQGLVYDDPNRIDDAPWNGEQRFCSVAAGDVDGDGDQDLYFGDYEQGGNRSLDVNDRLLINDGNGYFTDESAQRMTAVMLESSFGMKVAIVDMNNDGKLDILKDDALNAPQGISISYNNTATEGVFGTYDIAYSNTPYHFNVGDLNNDGWQDMIVSDDGDDRYILNQGAVGSNAATWSPTMAFSYSGGGFDDGFGGNNLIVDLDNDGWQDAVIADVDVDVVGCERRCHIFRNLGDAPNVTLQEQIVAGQVVGGIPPSALDGTFDVAVFDIDGDGWKDMVVGRCSGTEIYRNVPPAGMTFTFVGGQPSMIEPGLPLTLTVDVVGVGATVPASGTGVLHYSVDGGAFVAVPMTNSSPTRFVGVLPAFACTDEVRYYIAVQDVGGTGYSDPESAPAGFYSATVARGVSNVYTTNFEVSSAGWTVVDDPSLAGGSWQRADPNFTLFLGQIAAPPDDAEAGSAVFAMVTENGLPGAPAGDADVDGGPTDLISPVIDLSGGDGYVRYQRWFYSNGSDVLEVAVTGDGVNWTVVETIDGIGFANNQWKASEFRVGNHIMPTATTQVRFRVTDSGASNVVEAGIDVFSVDRLACEFCQPTFALQTVGSASLSMCGDRLSAATPDTELRIESMPPGAGGLLFFDVFPNPSTSPWNSGQLITPAPVMLGVIYANANGEFAAPLSIGGLLPPGWALYLQSVYVDASQPGQVGITNALRVEWN